ncbi:MAG: GNAT family N-acetyltransferase [Lautropia sp.]|nr:GNAT family N-acetyltransferase [Lautropia sp.]
MKTPFALTVRRMRTDDLDAVMATESQVQRFPWRRQQYEDALAAGYQAWVLVAPPRPAQPLPAPPVIAHAILMPVIDEVELLTLAVAANWQGQGLGRRWLNWLRLNAHQQGMQSMLLEVAAANTPAIRLYQGAGFQRIGERRAYYRSTDGQQDDAWVMRCDLGKLGACLAEAGSTTDEALHVID